MGGAARYVSSDVTCAAAITCQATACDDARDARDCFNAVKPRGMRKFAA